MLLTKRVVPANSADRRSVVVIFQKTVNQEGIQSP